MEIIEQKTWNPYDILGVSEVHIFLFLFFIFFLFCFFSNHFYTGSRCKRNQKSISWTKLKIVKFLSLFMLINMNSHPDKVPESEKAEAEMKFVDVSKAYKV